jgi:hypothetical protein
VGDGTVKTYQTKAALVRKINQTLLRYMDYTVVTVDGRYTAKFICLSDLEKETVMKEGFVM